MRFVSERRDDDRVERAVFKRRVTVIHIAQRNLFRNQVIQVHAALQVKSGVHRNIALEVGRTEVHALDALLAAYRVKDVQIQSHLGLRHADKIKPAADVQHSEALPGDGLQPDEVEHMIGVASGEKVANSFDRLRFRRVDNIGRAEAFGGLKPLGLKVDGHNPGCTGYASAAYRVKSDASGAEDHNSVTGTQVSSVQHGASTRDNAASQQRRRGEGHVLWYEGQLILVNKCPFGEPAQPQVLVQALSLAA